MRDLARVLFQSAVAGCTLASLSVLRLWHHRSQCMTDGQLGWPPYQAACFTLAENSAGLLSGTCSHCASLRRHAAIADSLMPCCACSCLLLPAAYPIFIITPNPSKPQAMQRLVSYPPSSLTGTPPPQPASTLASVAAAPFKPCPIPHS